MKYILTTFFCSALFGFAHSQGRVADSLLKLISHAKDDTLKVIRLTELSRHYFFELGEADKGEKIAKQSMEIARRKGYVKLEIEALRNLGRQYRSAGNGSSFSEILGKTLVIARQQNLVNEEIDVLRDMIAGYLSLGIPDSADACIKSAFDLVNKNSFENRKAELYILLARKVLFLHSDSAKKLSFKALSLARVNKQPLIEARAIEYLGYLLRGQAPDTSVILLKEAIDLYRRYGYKAELVNLFTNLVSLRVAVKPDFLWWLYFEEGLRLAGESNSRMDSLSLLEGYAYSAQSIGDYPSSLQKYFQVLEIYRELGNEDKVTETLSYIGSLYSDQQDYQRSLVYLHDAKAQCEKKNKNASLIWVLNLITANYARMKIIDSAEIYSERAYSLANQFYKGNIPSFVLNDMGDNFFEIGQYDRALQFLRKSYPELHKEGDQFNKCIAAYALAKLFNKTGPQDSCTYYAKQTLDIANENGFLGFIVKAGNLLTTYYKDRHIIDSAFHYQQIALTARDSLFNGEKQRQISDISFAKQMQQKEIEQQVEKAKLKYNTRMRMYFLSGGLAILLIIAVILLYNNRQKQKAKIKIERAYTELKDAQAQLVQREKMASLGELTAGIAHEIQNPLNFVNNFSEVNQELLMEMKDEMNKGKIDDALALADDAIENQKKINQHGKRADAIVKGMLQHSRSSSGAKEPTNINKLADEYLRLAYHGLRAKDKSFNATLKTDFDESIGSISIIRQDIGRVVLNLINNAFYSVAERRKQSGADYEPAVLVRTKKLKDSVEISVKDNGTGIPQKVVNKIFQPFFTTKPTGQGTGLGLSLSYDIVKAHGGELKVETKEGKGAEFIINLPII